MRWNEGKRAQPLRPERALTTASWVIALILLALNDHVLKQAGILPGWLTGKLSDFAGLYVAPALLASLLCVRTRRALALCHLLVGAVFAATNLDPRCAALAADAMRHLGFTWRIVTDAEDLIALPALLASQLWLGRAMARERLHARTGLVRSARYSLAGMGLLFCMATSDDDSWESTIGTSGPHLHNGSSETLVVLVQSLRPTVVLDCSVIAEAPAERLPESAFSTALAFRLRPHENLGLSTSGTLSAQCGAVRVSGSGLSPAIVFWRSSDDFARAVPRSYNRPDEYQDGAVLIEFRGTEHRGYKSIGGDFVHAIRRSRPEVALGCQLPDESARPAVSAELKGGRAVVMSADEGPDGCVGLRLSSLTPLPQAGTGGGVSPDLDGGVDDPDAGAPVVPVRPGRPAAPYYVCVPKGMFPFVAGDELDILIDADGTRRFSRRDAQGLPEVDLIMARVRDTSFIAGLDIRVRSRMNCPYIRSEACAQTAIAAEITVNNRNERLSLSAGEDPLHLQQGQAEIDLALPFGQRRVLLDTACAGGSKMVGADVEVVAVVRWGGP